MTRRENMDLVEVLRDLAECCRAAIKAGDWKVDGACDPDSLLRHADAAIASLSAPAEAQPCGCGEATCTVPWEPGCGLGKSEQHAVVEAASPSAPVGVSALDVFRIAGGDTECEPNPTPERALEVLRDLRACYDEALAQQPASDGGFTAADMMDARQEGRREAQQPAAVDGADANAAEIEALRAEREVIGAEAVKYAEKSGRLEARAERLAEALRLIESAKDRGFGIDYARGVAQSALRDHDQEDGNP